ncbi:MAG: MFS transporter [Flavobacteriaceae bacterium]|nr:MFS transporter [Flavobacteriaceae bacterium]
MKNKYYIYLLTLILAAESIYILPYVLARVFRPTFLDIFNLTNLELGTLFTTYGIVAFLSYIYGGVLADKYSPRKLLSFSLIFTSFGGIVMMTYPSYIVLQLLYAYWGFTTVFLFWAPMIKATTIIGGDKKQGKTFSFLDAGRGLVASSIGIIGVIIFSLVMVNDISAASIEDKKEAFKYVIGVSSAIVFFIGVIVYYSLRIDSSKGHMIGNLDKMKKLFRSKSVIYIGLIILCAYMGYKITDIYSLYASEVMMYDDIQSAKVGAYQQYLRPVVCLIIAFYTDRTGNINNIIYGFIIMLVGAILFSSGMIKSSLNSLFILSMIIVATGTYAIRGLYFSILRDGEIPIILTGTAIGIVSIIGYSPDIFATPLYGYILDTYPGISGHQFVYLVLILFSLIGIYVSLKFKKHNKL